MRAPLGKKKGLPGLASEKLKSYCCKPMCLWSLLFVQKLYLKVVLKENDFLSMFVKSFILKDYSPELDHKQQIK